MQKPAILHRFPRPATAGCTARIWKPYGPQPATGEPAVGKRGFYIRLSYIIHAVKRQNQRATVPLNRRVWNAPPLKNGGF